MKIILVLLDGLGDRSYSVLDHRTPLAAAETPNLDRLAGMGSNGLFHASSPGQCLPSETAHYLLFGYDLADFPGRGLLEAVGYGVPFDDGDVLCLAHLSGVTWRDGVPLLTSGRRAFLEGNAGIGDLYSAIAAHETGGIRFRLHRTGPNDAVLVMGGGASPHVTDSDPMVTGRPVAKVRPVSGSPEPEMARRTALALNDYLGRAHRILESHPANRLRADQGLAPANFLATQRQGRRIRQERFEDRWGLRGMLIASGAVYWGLARELGLTLSEARDGKDPGRDLRDRIGTALRDRDHDFIHVHTKVPDEAAHRGDPRGKRDAITALDRGLGELIEAVEGRDDLLAVVTADHSTPCGGPLIHSGEPVPVTIAGPTVRRDRVEAFDEVSAASGCLGLLRGRELMYTILNQADRAVLIGHRIGERETPFIPQSYEPFSYTT